MHSTNYTNTFIRVAEDCSATTAEVPPERRLPSRVRMEYELIHGNPYRYTSDEILFAIEQLREGIPPEEADARRAIFFSTGRACLRASSLAKRYGWGIHHDEQARVALVPRESEAYIRLSQDPGVTQLRAMRNRK